MARHWGKCPFCGNEISYDTKFKTAGCKSCGRRMEVSRITKDSIGLPFAASSGGASSSNEMLSLILKTLFVVFAAIFIFIGVVIKKISTALKKSRSLTKESIVASENSSQTKSNEQFVQINTNISDKKTTLNINKIFYNDQQIGFISENKDIYRKNGSSVRMVGHVDELNNVFDVNKTLVCSLNGDKKQCIVYSDENDVILIANEQKEIKKNDGSILCCSSQQDAVCLTAAILLFFDIRKK